MFCDLLDDFVMLLDWVCKECLMVSMLFYVSLVNDVMICICGNVLF